jgi:hypothetical protein
MGTRGLVGFRIDRKDKLAYNHFDSNPEELGQKALEFASEQASSEVARPGLRTRVRAIRLIEDTSELSKKEVRLCMPYCDTEVSTGSPKDLYCLLRKAQGELGVYAKLGLMPNMSEFAKDSLFCEWAYIINLDNNTLEVYQGFNKNPAAKGRYAKYRGYDKERDEWADYCGIRLIKVYSLDKLPTFEKFVEDCDPEASKRRKAFKQAV